MYFVLLKLKTMSKVASTHSSRPSETVHHNNDKCMTRNNIETRYLTQGDGKLPLCKECEKLNKEGK